MPQMMPMFWSLMLMTNTFIMIILISNIFFTNLFYLNKMKLPKTITHKWIWKW
nr:ATP synthase F0 subunit 8 [Proceratium itoi]